MSGPKKDGEEIDGTQVASFLVKKGLQSPIAKNKNPDGISRAKKLELIEHHFSKILQVLDIDIENPGVRETPQRVARLYVDELFKGL